MYKIKSRFLQSFVVIPLLGTTLATNPLMAIPTAIQGAINLTDKEISQEELTRIEHAAKIDSFFKNYDMPLEGYGRKMVEVAEENGLDWRLIPAIAARESTGGRHSCKSVPNNPFGWASCKVGFKSLDNAIEEIGAHLGGNNPRTERYYAGKDTVGIINTYNPPHIVASYKNQVLKIMKIIDGQNLAENLADIETQNSKS